MIEVAKKASEATDSSGQQETPSQVMDRLQLTPASRKRKAQIDLTDTEEQRVYPSAPKFKVEENPFMSSPKKAAVPSVSNKADPTALATTVEERNYYKDTADFFGRFIGPKFAEYTGCDPVRRAQDRDEAIVPDTVVIIQNMRIPVVRLEVTDALCALVPVTHVTGIIRAVNTIRRFDKDHLSNDLPIGFVLIAILRMNNDFGVVNKVYAATAMLDKPATTRAWQNKYAFNITHEFVDTLHRRVAGLVKYMTEHGLVKCHALKQTEVDQLVAATTDDTVNEYWGNVLDNEVQREWV